MDINKFVDSMNISEGDFILFTANVKKTFRRIKKNDKGQDLNVLIDALLEKVGLEGTLVFQTFNWDFCSKKEYDIKLSKAQTGALGNIALSRGDFIRTKHPIYSFAVKGKYSKDLESLDNKGAFDSESPFNFMLEYNAKMITLDLPLQNSFTFVHYVEQIEGVDYRFNKKFQGDYIDSLGNRNNKEYDMFVRDVDNGVLTDISNLEAIFLDEQVMEKNMYDGILIKSIDLKKSYEVISKDIRLNQAKNLYKVDK